MSMLEVQNLSVRFGSAVIVNDVSFSVQDGDWLMLIGPNGAGKSTIVNAVSRGVPHTGTVLFEGKDVQKTPAHLLARGMGVLAQHHTVGYAFSVEEVVRLGRYAYAPGIFSRRSDEDERSVAEEPTAFSVCQSDDTLTFLPFKNNETGFTATASDVGIAIGLKKGSELREQINAVLAEITPEQRSALMEQIVTLSSGGEVTEFAVSAEEPENPTGTLRVGMECAYEPYNWTDISGASFGAVPISGEGKDGLYANGYDVQIAKYVAARLGMNLEIYSIEWDSLLPALESGAIDAIAAGMSPTAERAAQIDFTDTYYESNLVVIIRK